MEDYVNKLREFYKKEKIGRDNFNCRNSKKCFEGLNISEGRRGSEAHVGSNYGEPFKVLIVSLDRGKEAENIDNRTKEIEGLREEVLNPHMKGTLATLKVILSDVKVNEDVELFRQFAMINAAKCCIGLNMNQAPWRFFKNCMDYTRGEIEILEPDVIITQGRRAADVFGLLYPDLKDKGEWYKRKGEISLNNKKVLVTCFAHPSARGNKWKNEWKRFVKEGLPKIIAEWRK